MSVDTGLLDLAYVGVMLGSMGLLGTLWRLLPWLLTEDVTTGDTSIVAPPWPRRGSSDPAGRVPLQLLRHGEPY